MSPGFLALSAVQILAGTLVPLALAWAWKRRAEARGEAVHWSSWGLGALVFILSQVVHLPLNAGLTRAFGPPIGALPADLRIVVNALVLGLSAGVCEEGARAAFFHFSGLRRGPGSGLGARSRSEAMMVGLGHGGIEAILFGTVLVAVTLSQLVAIERAGVASLGLDAASSAAVQAQLDALADAPWWSPLIGTAERLMVQPFHVAATMLVLYGMVRGGFRYVLLAILFHTLLDAGTLYWMEHAGTLGAELWVLGSVPVSALTIALVHRALPPPPAPVVDPRLASASPSGAPIELVAATKIYDGGRVALRAASFVLEAGSRTCLLGPNGAGKTTTIRLALGALAPTDGKVWLFGAGHDAPELLAAKRRVGVVPQQPGMYEDLTVRDYLELVRDLSGRGDLDAIARELELVPMLDRPMAKHSGGEQRRIVLAAALLSSPDLLVLDEPSAGLDPLAQQAMRRLLLRVGVGRTVLLCTHDLEEAEALSERVVILDRGEVRVHERIDVLKRRFVPTLRLRASGEVSALEAALRDRGLAPSIDPGSSAVRVPLQEGRAAVPAIVRALVEAGLDVEECVLEEASLEDIFLSAVRAASREIVTEREATDDSP